eukprot:TRINITY_DN16931_c0_g5_i1.p1 TRINITY_DN16931_c0_g5~~TRINITY_DN16931_c0_g5_i1.p1  ORF type:complete len:346 (+),score=157.20 TRINITY_DN16931_c0_g5_i1:42-1079(+)
MMMPLWLVGAALLTGASGSVVLMHDAGVDDYMCTVLLSKFSDFDGEVVVNADSVLPSSMVAAEQLHQVIAAAHGTTDSWDVDLSLSRARMYNPFPYEYRADSMKFMNLTEKLQPNTTQQWPFPDGDMWLERYLRRNKNVSLVIVSAPTPLTNLLKRHPCLARNIKAVYWMAGAVRVAGNLDPNQFKWNNSHAEWNVFTDPQAGADLLRQLGRGGVPLYLFPLDIADRTPINAEFFGVLQQSIDSTEPGSPRRNLVQLLFDAYQLVAGPCCPYYRLWDTVAAGYLLWPELYQAPETVSLEVVTSPPNEGWTRVCDVPKEGCYDVHVLFDFASDDALQTFIKKVAEA